MQARGQEMNWGFCKKSGKWGMFFCKKSGKWGVFCEKSGKCGVCFFVKRWTFPQCKVRYVQYQYFLFYILLIWGRVRTHPTHPPAYGPAMLLFVASPDVNRFQFFFTIKLSSKFVMKSFYKYFTPT